MSVGLIPLLGAAAGVTGSVALAVKAASIAVREKKRTKKAVVVVEKKRRRSW